MSSARRRGSARKPLSVSWREWLQHPDWAAGRWRGDPFDAIVVGSGYGGSVAALRLARKGWRVLLLERGSEYLTGEFPNDFAMVPKFVRMNVPVAGAPMGRASGLVELHLGQGLTAVTGNGLGGTSLLNAGVLMKPDADVFAQPAWPAAIRHGKGALERHFALTRQALGARPWSTGLPDDATLPKTAALQRLGAQLGREARPVEATIDPQRCRNCGDCAAGCNVRDAKLSLDATYLRQALETRRVQIVSQAEVYRFSHHRGPAGHLGWKVHVFATDAQQQFLATREVFKEGAGTARTLAAPMLFLCAGTFGSTQLLQRSQAQGGSTLSFSPALGTRVSGNGDSLSWLANEPQRVGAVGGSPAPAGAGAAHAGHAPVGPTITASIDLRTRADGDHRLPAALPLHERLVIEDGAVPRAIAQFFRELLATAGTLRQLDGWWFQRPAHPQAGEQDPLAASAAAADHAQTLLTMGHDGSPARIVWLEGLDRSAAWLPDPDRLATYQHQQKLFDRFGRRHVHSPLWQAMPQDALKLMSGDQPPRSVLTVHPLGGCVMGDDPEASVVNDRAQVWVHEPGRRAMPAGAIEAPPLDPVGGEPRIPGFANEPQVYKGLYVLDGSIVPTSLGCNPLWTITALAERALEFVPARPVAAPQQKPARGAQRSPRHPARHAVKIAATLNEVLLARAVPVSEGLARCVGSQEAAARFEATFATEDILHVMEARRHGMQVQAKLVVARRPGDAPAVEYASTQGSSFEALPAGPSSSGAALFWRCLAEFLLVLACLLAPLAAGLSGLAAHATGLPAAAWAAGSAGSALAIAALCWLVLLPLALLLPYPRTIVSWAILRGWRDIAESLRGHQQREGNWLAWALALFKQLVHASEKRVMRYRIPMRRAPQPAAAEAPAEVVLLATKTVMYRASVRELLAWLRRWWGRQPRQDLRPTLWQQVMNAQVVLVAGPDAELGPAVLAGVFEMGFENLTSSGLSSARRNVRPPIELGPRGDVTSGALALASYPLLFLRFALKTRLLDFRLPTYSAVPVRDQSGGAEAALRRPGRPDLPGELHTVVVPRGDSNNDRGDENTMPLKLQLWRYARRDEHGARMPPEVSTGRWMGVPVARARSVLLLHAFGQSGLSFTTPTIDENLAEHFYRKGYEVWVLETRMSTRSGYATDPCSIDQIAEHDVPGAVRYIVDLLARELPGRPPLQVGAFAQCIGSAALWMAALSGRLRHPQAHMAPGGEQLSMLSHAMFSQVHPWVVGSRGTQAKTWVPSVLHAIWHRGYVPFAVRGPQNGLLLPFLDRVLASMPVPPAERASFEGHDDAAATCRRIRFIEAPLFLHRNLNPATYGKMNLLFGDANLRLFAHARRFVDREMLVDEDGIGRYVTPDAIRRDLAFPVQLMHGRANELFDFTGACDSFTRLAVTHGHWQQQFCRGSDGAAGPLVVDGYGHLDVLIGKTAHQDVFPHVSEFFDACLRAPVHDRPAPAFPLRVARPPQVGPFVGWLRRDAGGQAWLRVSFGLDQVAALPARDLPPIVVRHRAVPRSSFTTLPLPASAWRVFDAGKARGGMVQRFAWADLPVPRQAEGLADWQVLTLHPSSVAHGITLATDHPGDTQLDAYLAQFPAALPQAVVPALSERGHGFDFARSLFQVPPAALQTLGRAADLRFALACCRHPGFGIDRGRVDAEVRKFLARRVAQPAGFGLLLGDQIYADATAGLLDPTSPLERYHERHEQAFDRPALGRLLSAMPVYMTPDDHEWVEAFPQGAPLRREAWPDRRPPSGYRRRLRATFRSSGEALTAYQRLQSPRGAQPAPWYAFEHGCARFFLLDSRFDRKRNQPRVAAERTLDALEAWLQQPGTGDALNVVACGSVVLPGLRANADPANPGPVDTWQLAPAQRRRLLAMLVRHVPGRFLLVSGDYHVSGAGHVRHRGRDVGVAVLAPPLYAPMPYANATPDAVFVQERIDLGAGAGRVGFRVAPGGEIARGSAVGTLEVHRRAGGGFTLRYERDLWVWEAGQSEQKTAVLEL